MVCMAVSMLVPAPEMRVGVKLLHFYPSLPVDPVRDNGKAEWRVVLHKQLHEPGKGIIDNGDIIGAEENVYGTGSRSISVQYYLKLMFKLR